MTDNVGTIIVKRPSGRYRDGIRFYRLTVDGEAIGKIAAGGEIVWELASGDHTIRARIDWSGSKPIAFHLAPDETLTFEVRPAGNALMSVFQVVGRTRYLTLELIESE